MRKYVNSKTLCASLVSAAFSTAFAMAELIMGLEQGAAAPSLKTAILTAAGYFGYFLVAFWVVVLCCEAAKKLLKVKILDAILAFLIYFGLESLFLYFSIAAERGAAAISLADFILLRLKSGQYIFSLQFFAIAYAFYKIFTSPKRS